MKVLIHACPKRMWYVERFLMPSLFAQGADVEVWNDELTKGNLKSCIESFQARKGNDATWHIQDDVLICRDFVERCEKIRTSVAYGFCNERFTDDPDYTGEVNTFNSWHSFQCVRIPDAYARECAKWITSGAWQQNASAELKAVFRGNMGDDTFFREFMLAKHSDDIVTNVAPNLVEHVDFLIGGSILNKMRCFWPRAHYWEDEELVNELKEQMKLMKQKAVF